VGASASRDYLSDSFPYFGHPPLGRMALSLRFNEMTDHQNRRFSDAHVWVLPTDDFLLLGITEYAQSTLGSIEHIELPEPGRRIAAGEICGVLESVKTVSDLIAPVDATVVEHNADVVSDPTLVNDHPFDDGWLIKLQDFDRKQVDMLLDAQGYQDVISA
jgi:glycine cleavage system H protein